MTKDEADKLVKEGKTLTLDRTTKDGKDYKVFAKFDKDLNRVVTSPYSKKIAERMAKSVKTGTTKKVKPNLAKRPGTKKQTGKSI